jgi:hypothetical protein
MALNRTKLGRGKAWWVALLVLAIILVALFHRSASDRLTLFSNDGPLGVLESQGQLSERSSNFLGVWRPLNWVGDATLPLMPDLSHAFFLAGGPLVYSKFHAPLALLFFGLAMALLFIRIGAPPAVVALVGVAAALNSDAISHACWGLPPIPLGMGCAVLAIAALTGQGPPGIARLVLAGFAVGLAVMESYDVGAILSLYVAAFVLFQALTGEGKPGLRTAKGVGGVALVAVAAGLISAQALSTLVGTQVKGISGMAQDEVTRAQRWREATQWSLPKLETLQIVVPGLFGYRMDTPDGGSYWGGVGRDPVWDDYLAGSNPDPTAAPAGALIRHSGAGFYAGVLVVLVAMWGLVHSWRGKGNVYLNHERWHLWFWAAAAFVSLLLAYGRHAPFYQVIYQLPFFSTIRNPIKFLHPMEISVVILFGYGLLGLWRGYVEPNRVLRSSFSEQMRDWWRSATLVERRWVLGSGGAVILAGLVWLFYSASTERMAGYLGRVGFPDRQLALEMARFSAGEAGLGLVFLAASVGAVVVLMSGGMSGKRQRWAGVLVGVILVTDLARASLPWIVYYDYREKYASNAVIDLLSERSHAHRVTGRIMPKGGMNLVNEDGRLLASMYNEWLEHLFPYYGVQSLDIVQMPRTPLLDEAYLEAFRPTADSDFGRVGRLWELTNTRYVLGMTGFLDFLNQQFDPGKGRFRVHTPFTVGPKAGVEQVERLSQLDVVPLTNGPFALFEFDGALPRASLLTRWELSEGDPACLERLLDPTFDPREAVLVSGVLPAPAGSVAAESAGAVEFEEYQPKRIELRARATAPSVLLLNDRWHEHWKVYVNGERRELLRCNYLMRGVFLEPGEATVEFRFEPPVTALYISLAAIVAGVVLLGMMVLGSGPRSGLGHEHKDKQADPRPTSGPGPRRNV